eukprot:COSAG01_NODE_2069_length_8498_cov_5.965841_6_plen_44_part_00
MLGQTSPLTNARLANKILTPNLRLKAIVDAQRDRGLAVCDLDQ